MLIEVEESALLVVDAQARLAPAVAGGEACLDRLRLLVLAAKRLGVPILATEQYPKGLGPTVDTLAELLAPAQIHAKLAFSAAADPAIRAAVQATRRRQIIICGMEAHVCVLQSALGFLALGLRPIVVADAVASRRLDSMTLALARLRSSGVEVVDSEMVVFEWLRQAGTPAFKALSALIK